jgi:uncharacterized protein YecE (DUF72 family)
MTEAPNRSLLRLGTSSFTADGWNLTFYPPGLHSRDYLSYYATQFDTLEVDATFYGLPAVSTVQGWYNKTPPNFQFALKTPQEITHECVLVNVDSAFNEFLHATEPLAEKLAVILLQFPYFSQNTFASSAEFLARLKPFLEKLPAHLRFALEIRNKHWLGPVFYDLLRRHNVALALIDHPWMPRPNELSAQFEFLTTDFTYIRWLGDRKPVEALTKVWDKTIIDRSGDLQEWAEACRSFQNLKIRVYAFANNHYEGHAPATLRFFRDLMENNNVGGRRTPEVRNRLSGTTGSLFDGEE